MTIGILIIVAIVLVTLAILARIVRCYMSDPAAAMKLTSHDPTLFPQIMAGRYLFFGFVVAGAALSGNLWALAFVFAGLSGLGFYDAWIYKTAGRSPAKHAKAGVGCAVACVICVAFAVFGG